MRSFAVRFIIGTISLCMAACIWLPIVHLFYTSDPGEYSQAKLIPSRAQKLANRHLRLWADPTLREHGLQAMRATNPEWDLMGRTYLVLSLVNMTLREPATQGAHLEVVDQIIDDTIALEQEHGFRHFLLPYARAKAYVFQPARSHFVDSQIALMLAARLVLAEHVPYKMGLAQRIEIMADRMERGPVLSAESYPDECWMFDNTAALAVMHLADFLNSSDHTELFRRWLATAKARLTDPQTGLLVSSFTSAGRPLDGPEGSTLWMAGHHLQLIDPDFAAAQYARAKKELARTFLGFGYASEWPASRINSPDVDSGPTIPGLNANAGASGLALVGASAFGDSDYLSTLFATLDFAAFPTEKDNSLKYCASNQVGDALVLYATVLGPLWEKVKAERLP